MGQPVKLSDELVLDARLIGDATERSIAGQIEYWAQLGRAIEPLLDGARALALHRSGKVQKLSEIMGTIDGPSGRARVADFLKTVPFPHFEQVPDAPGMLVRIDESGNRTLGRFVGREFRPARD